MEYRNKNQIFFMINMIAPLIIGAFIYYLISPEVWFVQTIDACLGKGIHLRNIAAGTGKIEWIRNYLPDMLWGYSLIYVLLFVYGNKAAEIGKILVIAMIFSAIIEILQLTHVMTGTFDGMDILLEFLAEWTAVFIIKINFVRGGAKET